MNETFESVNSNEKSEEAKCLNESQLSNIEPDHLIEENKSYETVESIDTFVDAGSKTQKFNTDIDAFKSVVSLNNSSTESHQTNNIQRESPKETKQSLNETLVINSDENKVTNVNLNSSVAQDIVSAEPEYEKFNPQTQSTTLVSTEQYNLEEAALSVAKNIESSFENIQESEQFFPATSECK